MSNPHITPEARKLLQRLTAKLTTLDYREDTQEYFIGADALNKKQTAAAKEILHLCCVSTDSKLFPWRRFRIAEEGLRCLLREDYIPIIKRRTVSTEK